MTTRTKRGPKRRKPARRSPRAIARRVHITRAVERELDQKLRMEFPQVFSYSDHLAKLERESGVDPKHVREILVSPFAPLGQWRDLEEELRGVRSDLRHALGAWRDHVLAVVVPRVEGERAALAPKVQLGSKRWTKRPGTMPPGDRFWKNMPADLPDDERWLNPRDWPWLRERAARLADYLRTTRLVNPTRPWHKGAGRDRHGTPRRGPGRYDQAVLRETARLITLAYRWYFRRLVFTPQDAKTAVDLFFPALTSSERDL